MSDERQASARQRCEEAISKGMGAEGPGSSTRDPMRRSSKGCAWARPPVQRFIERSLHEAYAATLREKVPRRFTELLDRLRANQGGADGRAR